MRGTVQNIGFDGILPMAMCNGNPCATLAWCNIFYILVFDFNANAEFVSQGSCSPLFICLYISECVSVC